MIRRILLVSSILPSLSSTRRTESDFSLRLSAFLTYPARLLSLLSNLLPPNFFHHLPSPSSTLEPYTNGHLLCHAFNIAVRRSARPWGFVLEHEIHDFLGEREEASEQSRRRSGEGLEGGGPSGGRKEYVFRKVENLRVFAA